MSRFLEATHVTPNVSRGINERLGVVLHHTAGAFDGAVAWLTRTESKASAHVVIAKNGTRAVLAPDDAITWHAGNSAWKGRSGCNAFMVGVEFELTPEDVRAGVPLSDAQIDSCVEWLAPRMTQYGWTVADITDHRTVALPRGRKADLSPANFDLMISVLRDRFVPDDVAPLLVNIPRGTRRVILNIGR